MRGAHEMDGVHGRRIPHLRPVSVMGAFAALVSALTLSSAEARLGETPEECQRRYGAHLTERQGAGLVPMVRVYKNASFYITIAFAQKPHRPVTAGCVIYGKYAGRMRWTQARRIEEAERDGLMATVAGKWQSYSVESKLARSAKRGVKRMSVQPNQIALDRRDRASKALAAVSNLLMPDRPPSGYPIAPIAHNRSRTFAFMHGQQLALLSVDGVEALENWQQVLDSLPKEEKRPAAPPPGF